MIGVKNVSLIWMVFLLVSLPSVALAEEVELQGSGITLRALSLVSSAHPELVSTQPGSGVGSAQIALGELLGGATFEADASGAYFKSGSLAAARTGVPDADFDTVADHDDNCLIVANALQADFDGDGQGDGCDPDDDGDGIVDAFETNTGVYIGFYDTGTDPFNPDSDGDSIPDGLDTAPLDAGIGGDLDGDGLDNLVDTDIDGDGQPNSNDQDPFDADNCRPLQHEIVLAWGIDSPFELTRTVVALSVRGPAGTSIIIDDPGLPPGTWVPGGDIIIDDTPPPPSGGGGGSTPPPPSLRDPIADDTPPPDSSTPGGDIIIDDTSGRAVTFTQVFVRTDGSMTAYAASVSLQTDVRDDLEANLHALWPAGLSTSPATLSVRDALPGEDLSQSGPESPTVIYVVEKPDDNSLYGVEGTAFQDRFNESCMGGGQALVTADSDTVGTGYDVWIETMVHELGHLWGLQHIAPDGEESLCDPSLAVTESVMDHVADGAEVFANCDLPGCPIIEPVQCGGQNIGAWHNPSYHFLRFVMGMSDEELYSEGIRPGNWDDPESDFEFYVMTFEFRTPTNPANLEADEIYFYNVRFMEQLPDHTFRCIWPDPDNETCVPRHRVSLAELNEMQIIMPKGSVLRLIASSEYVDDSDNDGVADEEPAIYDVTLSMTDGAEDVESSSLAAQNVGENEVEFSVALLSLELTDTDDDGEYDTFEGGLDVGGEETVIEGDAQSSYSFSLTRKAGQPLPAPRVYVPEPSAPFMLLVGLGGLLFLARKRTSRRQP